MDILARDDHRQPTAPQEARLWGFVGVALVLGVIGVVGFAWKIERMQFALADPSSIVRSAPVLPDWPPVP